MLKNYSQTPGNSFCKNANYFPYHYLLQLAKSHLDETLAQTKSGGIQLSIPRKLHQRLCLHKCFSKMIW